MFALNCFELDQKKTQEDLNSEGGYDPLILLRCI